MEPFRTYVNNPLSDPRISLERKKKFGEDAIVRVTRQNIHGEYDADLPVMITTQTTLFGDMTHVISAKAQSEARTKVVNKVMQDFIKRNTKLNRYFVLNEIDKQAVYEEFFPQGVMEFTEHVTKENVGQKMQAMITAIHDNTAVAGGQSVLDEYTRFLSDYENARTQQLGKFADTAAGRTALRNAETAWDNAFFGCLLTVARNNMNHPEILRAFFDKSLLHTTPHVKHEKFGGTLAPGEVAQVFNEIFPEKRKYRLVVKSDNAEADFWMSLTPETTHGNDYMRLSASETSIVSREELHGDGTTPYLQVQNASGTNSLDWEVEVLPE